MTKDLLQVLRQDNAISEQNYQGNPLDAGGMGAGGAGEDDHGMDEFFAEVESIRRAVDKIDYEVGQVRNKQSEILSAPQQNEKTKLELEELNNSIKKSSEQVRLKLKQLEVSIHQQEVANPSSATVRIQRTQQSTITRRFMDVTASYSKVQADYRDACKEQLKVKMEIAERPVTDEELEQMIESGNSQVFTQGILMDTQQARQNVADIEARHQDIIKLERSIREIRDLFTELAQLVHDQGEQIDRIDYNVNTTKDHVEAAKIATKKAVVYKKKSRKCTFILIGVACAVVLIVVLIIIGMFVR
ncbi:unnamed protein product [Calicophoron daubneyi]|uniref:t-SNARE coiled-coil homology domain-containing protein n=1 Tax=Calicophoron daubneyi TaxID=300641 RepID=A0AAV2TYY8_CALDB